MEDLEIEKIILSSLCLDENYSRQCLLHLKTEYFQDEYLTLFKLIDSHSKEYNTLPNKTILFQELNNIKKEQEKSDLKQLVNELFKLERPASKEWLLEKTEEFCRTKAVYNAIVKSLSIYDGTEKTLQPHAIPDLLAEAIAVTFDSSIGLDYLDDAEKLYQFITQQENKVPFKHNILNKISNGGVTTKTLNILAAAINCGKSLALVDLAVGYIQQGYNVLYISLEMSEEAMMQRLYANLFNHSMNELNRIGKEPFLDKIQQLKAKNYGKFKVKSFGTDEGHSGHFRALLSELKLKQKFVPEIVIVDYLTICASAKLKPSNDSYGYYKSISAELRAIAQANDLVMWTAIQINRNSQNSSEVSMADIASSIAIAANADFMLSLIRTEELDDLGQIKISQMKNRYSDKTKLKNFIMAVELEKQKLFDVNDDQQTLVSEHDLKVSNDEETNFKVSMTNMTNNMKHKFSEIS